MFHQSFLEAYMHDLELEHGLEVIFWLVTGSGKAVAILFEWH